MTLLADALKARDAAESVYMNLPADALPEIEEATFLYWLASQRLVNALLKDERRAAAAPAPVSEVQQTTY